MPDRWPVQERIRQLKGDMTYRELSDAIFKKTGKQIGFTALSKLGSGDRQLGRPSTIAILAEYADKPLSWFYEEDNPAAPADAVAEARAVYLTPTGDELEDDTRAKTWEAFERDVLAVRGLHPDDVRILINLAHDLARRRRAGE